MSFVTTVRDYIELLNNVYDSVSNNIDLQKILYLSLIFLAKSLKYIFLYLISFQWFHDLTYLPVLIPEFSHSIIKENFFLNLPTINFFNIFETSSYQNNKFFVGFFNSFFASLPLSCSHFILARRLVLQGTIAGIVSALGHIFGQCVFLIFILFGVRFFIIPWFSFEPIHYFFGIILLLTIVYDMVHERRMRPIQQHETKLLVNIFFRNFLLVLMEQSCIFQYLGNVTSSSQITLLDANFGISIFDFFLQNSLYIFGFFIGSIVFIMSSGILLLKLINFFYKKFSYAYSTWLKNLNYFFLISIIGFSFSSIPFYSMDYLLMGPLGFVSEDKVFEKTIFSPNTVKDSIKLIGASSSFKSLDTDISSFDKGTYLKNDSVQTYEDLNFQGEYAWTTRQDRRSLYQQEKSRELILNLFKKTKSKTDERKSDLTKQGNNEDFTLIKQSKNSNLPGIQKDQDQEKNFIKKSTSSFFIEKQSDRFFSLNERFTKDYQLDDQKTSETFNILMDDSFSREFIQEDPKTKLEKKIKQKFYFNPIYKFLLTKEIDLFLFRQPVFYALDSTQEKLLYEKRLRLKNYYDSLRFYNELPFLEDFNYLFNGSKNYADRVYNQQFKGTLKIVRRLFCITLNQNYTIPNSFVLKYDQPLFKDNNFKENFIIHEELSIKNIRKTPFLELTNPIPFYIGWDENLKKLILTNRLLPRFYSGFEITQINPKTLNKNLDNSKKYKNLVHFLKSFHTQENIYSIEFSTWPIPKKILTKPKSESQIPYIVLFESVNDPQNKLNEHLFKGDEAGEGIYETLPSNVKKTNNLGEIIPPSRGGFIWPGNIPLKINFKELLTRNN